MFGNLGFPLLKKNKKKHMIVILQFSEAMLPISQRVYRWSINYTWKTVQSL